MGGPPGRGCSRASFGAMSDDAYAPLRAHFADMPGVTVNSGRGAQGIKFGTKMFIMFLKGDLLVKLPPARVTELIETGGGQGHDPGTGKIMKDRILIPVAQSDTWIALCEESKRSAEG